MANNKTVRYQTLAKEIHSLIDGIDNWTGMEANVSAAIKSAFPEFFWVGFYNVVDNALQLGPFQGEIACYHIKKGKGVCGTSFERNESILVPDVDQFPGHIACSSLSRSEIVVPVRGNDNEVIAVLDIDSTELNAFDSDDQFYLEQICNIVGNALGGCYQYRKLSLTLDEYQKTAVSTAIYPRDMAIIYPTIGLAGETGEVAEKIKKVIRDKNRQFDETDKQEIALELGDVLWYLAAIANDMDYSLGKIADMNVNKLAMRAEKDKIHGRGDHR